MSNGTANASESATGRERILDAAVEVIARRGYSAAGVQEIVDLSSTSKGSFYFHFPSKEQMVMALVERMSEKLIERVRRSSASQPTPLHRLATSIDALIDTFARQRKVAQVLLLNIMGNGKVVDKKFLPVREKFVALIQAELEAAVAAGQIEPVETGVVSRIWLGGLNELILHWLLTGRPEPLTSAAPALKATLLRSVGVDLADMNEGPQK